MIIIVISILLTLLALTVPSWWSTRERVRTQPAHRRLLTTLARLWLATRRRPDTALRRLARPVIFAALRQARRVDGDVRLTLPDHLVIHAHRDDVALLVRHKDEFTNEIAAVLRRDLGFLVVTSRPALRIDVDPTVLPTRPQVEVMDPGPTPAAPTTAAPTPASRATDAPVVQEHQVRQIPEPADTLVVPASDPSTTPLMGDQHRRTPPMRPATEGPTVVVPRR